MLKAADFLENNQNFRVACGQSIIADESFLNKNYKRKSLALTGEVPYLNKKML